MKKILLWLFVIIVLGVGAAWWAGQQVGRAYRGFPGRKCSSKFRKAAVSPP